MEHPRRPFVIDETTADNKNHGIRRFFYGIHL
jgi:hypothetical protein